MKPYDLLNSDAQDLAKEYIISAKEYAEARDKAGKARRELYIFLLSRLGEYRKGKKNLGKEMAIFMVAEENEHAKQAFMEMLEWEDKYKGLEVVIEALKTRISLYQSFMRYTTQGEQFGI